MNRKHQVGSTVFLWSILLSFVGFSQPSIGDEGFKVISEQYTYDKNLNLNPETIEVTSYPTFNREQLIFTGVRERVGAYLATPTKTKGPFPLVLLIDGMGGSKDRWFNAGSWPNGMETTEALIDKGFAVLTIDAAMHGERLDTSGIFPEPLLLRKQNLMSTVHAMIQQTVQDYMRALDYLETRKEISTTQVGAYGLSMGGAVTFILAGLDSRIKVAATGVAVVYGNQYSAVNAYNFTPRIKNKPFLMLMGTTDWYYTPKTATELFNSIGGKHNQLIIFEGGHKVPLTYTPTIVNWFVDGLL